MRMLINLAITIAVIYLILVLLVFLGQSRLIYFPEIGREIVAEPSQVGLSYELVEIVTTDHQTLYGWFIPAQEAKATVLFFHGNAGNISHRLDYLSMFNRLGYNTLIFDYRGYGQSGGKPSELGTYQDALAAWRFLIEDRNVAASDIVLFGESLGGAVAAWLAVQQKPGKLILVSTFTSVPDLAEEIYPFLPVRQIARFEYNTLANLHSVTCPILIAHSPQDEVVPFTHGQKLYQTASNPKQFLTLQGGHNDGLIFKRDEWIIALDVFMRNK